jgi:hypothetical protein
VWDDLLALQAGHGANDAASADLDVQAKRYAALYRRSAAIAHDAVETDRRRLREQIDQPRWAKSSAPEPRGVAEMPVGEVGGRDLLRVVAGRLRRKVTRQ